MPVAIYHKSYADLKSAYLEVKRFLEKETGDEVCSLKTGIGNDLGFDGDDSWELLDKFVRTYDLKTEGFEFDKHFLSEGEIGSSDNAFLQLVFLPIRLSIWLVKLLSFGRIKLAKDYKFPGDHRDIIDLSFGDMLTWYLTGRYLLRHEVRFHLANPL